MKSKMLIATLLGCLVWQQGALSQTDTIATNPAATDEIAPANQPAIATDTNQSIGTSTANPPAAPVVSAPESPSTTTSTVTTSTVTTSNETTSTVTTTNETASAANPQPPEPPTIPLIQFQDVPITTAIENLARQAGINYLIDPKIGYGQPDQNGQIKPEPTLSIRWENVTAGQALIALLDNYGLQLSEDRKSQIARISAKDPAAPLPLSTRVVQLKYASTSNMVDSVQAALIDKRSRVIPDTRTSQIVIVATEREQEAVDALINALDKPTRQVLIETKLVEISSNPSTKKGIDWTGTLAGQNVSFGNNVLAGRSGQPYSQTLSQAPLQAYNPSMTNLSTVGVVNTTTYGANNLLASPSLLLDTAHGLNPSTLFLNADGVHAVLSFLNASADAQVVSTPRIVTLDNETATIAVTRGFPVINVSAGTQNTAGGSSITYSNVGTILKVTPRISANDYIWLKVIPEVSSFFNRESITVAGAQYQADVFDTRRIETQVLIPNAHTLVMGGLVKDSPNAQYTKVPILGDIPGLGWLFRSENKTLDKGNLLIFITPTIVQEADFRPTPTDFLRSRPNLMKSPMNPNSIWDSAEPLGDWSNPAPVPGEFNKTPATQK